MTRFLSLSVATLFVFGAFFANTDSGGTKVIQGIRDFFHFFKDAAKSEPKNYPDKFEKDIKEQLRYPERDQTK